MVQMEQTVLKGRKELLGMMVQMDKMEQMVLKVHKGHKVQQEMMVQTDKMVQMVQME